MMTLSVVNKKTFRIFTLLVLIQAILLQNTCNGQFHWAKNYRWEAQKLRELLLKELRNPGHSELDNIVSSFLGVALLSFYSKNIVPA